MKYLNFIFLLAMMFVSVSTAHAQLQSLDNQSGGIIINSDPANPKPRQFVTVTIQSYTTDLDRSEVSWFVNGVLQKKAIGEKSFLFKTGGLGSFSNILVTIKTPEGEFLQSVLNINPASLDLMWEAQSYTPPFFEGKASYPFEGSVKIVAMPSISNENGVAINPKTLVYTWSINGDAVSKVSGYGRNFMFLDGTIPINATTVSVEAATLDKKYVAKNSITITPSSSQIILYEDSPTLGVLYNKALTGSLDLQNQEIRIASIPFFLSAKNREDGTLKYEWTQNDQQVNSSDTSSLSFKQSGGAAGNALIGVQVSHLTKILQFVHSGLSINFGQSVSGGVF
ncbi:MAG: hypothetical protein V4467_02970 [Patescibacteria group bacterium]